MTSLNVDKICERVARPYLKHHGTTIAGLIVNGESNFRAFSGKQCSDTASKMRNAIFEIGSITKTFTAILVCELARQGKIKLDDPISKYLHGFDTLPDWITPRSLSSHTSGLPRIPDGMDIADMANPYKGISREKLADWVKTIATFPPRSPKMSYSNLGVGILGLAASEIAGSDFRTALEDIVLAPLGLADTDTIVSPENVDRLAPPHGLFGRKVQVWDFDALAGCGALKSTANDMASYANAFISAKNGSNGPAV